MKYLYLLFLLAVLPTFADGQSGPPALCKPCLFYGGDFDEHDPNSFYLADENTNVYSDTSTYGAVTIPANHSALLEGFFFQIIFDGTVKLDPNGVTWEIRTGVSEGNGGALLASGEQSAKLQPTGREGNGPEYTVAIKLRTPIVLTGGTYWFNVTPPCLGHDPVCNSNTYGVSNSTHRANSFRGGLQPEYQMFINSKAFDYTWKNWCDLGNQEACASLSFGLIGKVMQ